MSVSVILDFLMANQYKLSFNNYQFVAKFDKLILTIVNFKKIKDYLESFYYLKLIIYCLKVEYFLEVFF